MSKFEPSFLLKLDAICGGKLYVKVFFTSEVKAYLVVCDDILAIPQKFGGPMECQQV